MPIEYLNNKVFEELIANYKKYYRLRKRKSNEFRNAENQLAEAFYILADNISRAFKFQLIDVEDMRQEGVKICLEKIDCFDPNYVTESGIKSRAFNYYTTCILNHFRQLYRAAKGYKQFMERYFDFFNKSSNNRMLNLMADTMRYRTDDE